MIATENTGTFLKDREYSCEKTLYFNPYISTSFSPISKRVPVQVLMWLVMRPIFSIGLFLIIGFFIGGIMYMKHKQKQKGPRKGKKKKNSNQVEPVDIKPEEKPPAIPQDIEDVINGLVDALRGEYINGEGGAVGNFLDQNQGNAFLSANFNDDMESQVREAGDQDAAIQDVATSLRAAARGS